MFAIIGGSGLAKLTALEAPRRQVMRTPYGSPSGALTFGRLGPVACLGVVVALPLAASLVRRRTSGERGAPSLAAMSVAMLGIAGLELAATAG